MKRINNNGKIDLLINKIVLTNDLQFMNKKIKMVKFVIKAERKSEKIYLLIKCIYLLK